MELNNAQTCEELLNQVYLTEIQQNEKQFKIWSDYKKNHEKIIEGLEKLSLELSVNCVVPLGKRAFMKGKLMHTNEILVSIGDGYFAKYSAQQAIGLCKRRIERSEVMLKKLEQERNLLEIRQMMPLNSDAFGLGDCKELVEHWDEKKLQDWKAEHRKKEKEYRQKLVELKHSEKEVNKDILDDDLFRRLDELEIEEEIADELNRLEGYNQNFDQNEEIDESEDDTESEEESEDEENEDDNGDENKKQENIEKETKSQETNSEKQEENIEKQTKNQETNIEKQEENVVKQTKSQETNSEKHENIVLDEKQKNQEETKDTLTQEPPVISEMNSETKHIENKKTDSSETETKTEKTCKTVEIVSNKTKTLHSKDNKIGGKFAVSIIEENEIEQVSKRPKLQLNKYKSRSHFLNTLNDGLNSAEPESHPEKSKNSGRRVSFADNLHFVEAESSFDTKECTESESENEKNCVENENDSDDDIIRIEFKHSDTEYSVPEHTDNVINNPSDIYKEFGKPKSILKKTTGRIYVSQNLSSAECTIQEESSESEIIEKSIYNTIVQDIQERKVENVETKCETDAKKPISRFKLERTNRKKK